MKLASMSLVSSFFSFCRYSAAYHAPLTKPTFQLRSSSRLFNRMGFSHHFSSDSTGDDTPVTSNFAECLPPIPTNSKRLFLIRHGEVINPGGDKPVFYGCLDVKLSPLGELEAKVRTVSYGINISEYSLFHNFQDFNLYKKLHFFFTNIFICEIIIFIR